MCYIFPAALLHNKTDFVIIQEVTTFNQFGAHNLGYVQTAGLNAQFRFIARSDIFD